MLYDRHEDLIATHKRHPSRVRHRTAVDREGRLLAMEIDVLLDGGAVSLEHGAHAPRTRVRPLEPYRFSGAWPTLAPLLGARASSASPLAKLTPDLVRLIIELVRRDCRTHVVLETAPVAGLALHAPT
ncbi:MAG: molybdopterin cofactor-binding domain-containing protein, partial [bacterium]